MGSPGSASWLAKVPVPASATSAAAAAAPSSAARRCPGRSGRLRRMRRTSGPRSALGERVPSSGSPGMECRPPWRARSGVGSAWRRCRRFRDGDRCDGRHRTGVAAGVLCRRSCADEFWAANAAMSRCFAWLLAAGVGDSAGPAERSSATSSSSRSKPSVPSPAPAETGVDPYSTSAANRSSSPRPAGMLAVLTASLCIVWSLRVPDVHPPNDPGGPGLRGVDRSPHRVAHSPLL